MADEKKKIKKEVLSDSVSGVDVLPPKNEALVEGDPIPGADIKVSKKEPVLSNESEAKQKFRAFIEAYAKQNPVKFEGKKEALLKKLNSIN